VSDIEETWGENLGRFGVGPVEDVAIFCDYKKNYCYLKTNFSG
jgi:hypothetical protein